MFWILWPLFGFFLVGSFESLKVLIEDRKTENGICSYLSLTKLNENGEPIAFLILRCHGKW